MKRIFIVMMALIFALIACGKDSLPPQDKSQNPPFPKVIVEKEKVRKEQPLPPEVKIKLKKDGKDSYSWELTGSDVDQVLKVNEKLRKQLGGEPPR
jgi:predicted small lipoprotein YifL